MKLLSHPSEIEWFLNKNLSKYKPMRWAVAWAPCNTNSLTKLVGSGDKIDLSSIGIHFNQADPDFIEELLDPQSNWPESGSSLSRHVFFERRCDSI